MLGTADPTMTAITPSRSAGVQMTLTCSPVSGPQAFERESAISTVHCVRWKDYALGVGPGKDQMAPVEQYIHSLADRAHRSSRHRREKVSGGALDVGEARGGYALWGPGPGSARRRAHGRTKRTAHFVPTLGTELGY